MMERENTLYKCLPNGIRVLHRREASAVVYCGFAINVGTRDESEDESGMAHYIEHTLFKGTKRRKAWHILNCLEGVGGDINAYTTKEETFVYATTLKEDFEKAMDLCSDIVFHATFPQQELDKEVEVIIDEINSYNDTPSELICDEFESQIFCGAQLGRNILGEEKRLREYKTEDALRFVRESYATDRILFFCVGDVKPEKVWRLAQKYFGDVEQRGTEKVRIKADEYEARRVMREMNTHQAHAMVGMRCYSASDPKRKVLYLLNNILGGPGMNSKLNLSVRERAGLAYTIDSIYTAYSDDGILAIYFGTDTEDVERCLSLVKKEMRKLRETAMTGMQLERAKRQLMGQLAISQENKEGNALGMAKSYMLFDRDETLEDVAKAMEGITSGDILDVAGELFADDMLSELLFLGKEE